MSERKEPMRPEIIAGRYRIEREVGRGGMGAVWLATDERLGRPVAVKQVGHLPGELVPDLARAMREARSSAALNHRNVVAVYDAIEEGDHIWLVMEFVPGRTLSEIVAQDGPMPAGRAAMIGAQVADGLAAAHAAGTVHRDVKPGNILITEDGIAKIADFGIARTMGDATITQTGLMTGTPAYFSPELARGAEPSTATDVWALGATLYAAVEGRSPFPDQANALALLATIAQGAPPRPERAGELTEAIGRMMDPDPGRRWSMADCAHALHRVTDAHAGDSTRQQTAVAAAVPAAAVALDPEPTPATPVTPDPTPEPVPVAPAATSTAGSSRTRRILLLVAVVAVAVILVAVASSVLGEPEDTEPAAQDQTPTAAASKDSSEEPAPEETTEATTEASEPTPEETTEAAPPATSGDAETFVADYYAVLPSDTRTGWSMLSPGYQDGTSYGEYSGFWRTIDAVSVQDTRPAEDGAVDVDLVYTTDGSSQSETRRIYLEETDDGYLIVDDGAVG